MAEQRDPPWHYWFPWRTTALAIIVASGLAWTMSELEPAVQAYVNRPHLPVDYFIRD